MFGIELSMIFRRLKETGGDELKSNNNIYMHWDKTEKL
jgi:hypothetical protein